MVLDLYEWIPFSQEVAISLTAAVLCLPRIRSARYPGFSAISCDSGHLSLPILRVLLP
jgi:hypothetical protein